MGATGSDSTSFLSIDLDAIQHNISCIRSNLSNDTRIMVMVKANAYGIGDLAVSWWMPHCGIDILGVKDVKEAIHLRKHGVNMAIFAFHALPDEVEAILDNDIEVAVSDKPFFDALSRSATERQQIVKAHIHFDTGMSRLGADFNDTLMLAQQIHTAPWVEIEGVMTHLHSADLPSHDDYTLQQVKRLESLLTKLRDEGIIIPYIHAGNSAGALRFSLPFCNMIRLGISAYGLLPSLQMSTELPLRCAVKLESSLVGINTCPQGGTVSYGGYHTALDKAAKIGVVPLGYYDGIHRCYSNVAKVMIRGVLASVVGKITMNYFMIDISHLPDAIIGDKVIVFGDVANDINHPLHPSTMTLQAGTIPHELITCIPIHVPRVYQSTTGAADAINKRLQQSTIDFSGNRAP